MEEVSGAGGPGRGVGGEGLIRRAIIPNQVGRIQGLFCQDRDALEASPLVQRSESRKLPLVVSCPLRCSELGLVNPATQCETKLFGEPCGHLSFHLFVRYGPALTDIGDSLLNRCHKIDLIGDLLHRRIVRKLLERFDGKFLQAHGNRVKQYVDVGNFRFFIFEGLEERGIYPTEGSGMRGKIDERWHRKTCVLHAGKYESIRKIP